MTRILVAKEKYGDRFFDITTNEQLDKVALFILRSRFDEGCWYPKPHPPKTLDFSKSDIEKAPASIQAEMKKVLATHRDVVIIYDDEKEDYDNIVKALDTNDGKLAMRILRNRDGYEYEGCQIEECEEVE